MNYEASKNGSSKRDQTDLPKKVAKEQRKGKPVRRKQEQWPEPKNQSAAKNRKPTTRSASVGRMGKKKNTNPICELESNMSIEMQIAVEELLTPQGRPEFERNLQSWTELANHDAWLRLLETSLLTEDELHTSFLELNLLIKLIPGAWERVVSLLDARKKYRDEVRSTETLTESTHSVVANRLAHVDAKTEWAVRSMLALTCKATLLVEQVSQLLCDDDEPTECIEEKLNAVSRAFDVDLNPLT